MALPRHHVDRGVYTPDDGGGANVTELSAIEGLVYGLKSRYDRGVL